jgi:Raf kinase inhibitor-like YbhB/YbcL family protein
MNEMHVTSPVFEDQGSIPTRYTCDGDNTNPPLHIDNIPPETQSVVIIVDDPDAPVGTFTHWVACNIPVDEARVIPEGYKAPVEGTNGFGSTGYGGPCPPSGTHRYFFKVYALDDDLDVSDGVTKPAVENKLEMHTIGRGKIVGLYERS